MTTLNKKQSLGFLVSTFFWLALSACDSTAVSSPKTQAATEDKNILTVVTHPSETSYFESKDGADGFEYQLINKFAKQHNYKLKLVLANNEDEVYQALDHGVADLAMIGHPLSLSKQAQYQRSQALMDVTTQLIYRHGSGKPRVFDDLLGKKVLVPDNLQYQEKYSFLKQQYPELDWTFTDKDSDQVLKMLDRGLIDYTLVDSHVYIGKKSLYPHTRVAFDLYYPEPISWVLAKEISNDRRNSIDSFLDTATENGTIKQLQERFYGHTDDVNHRGSMTFFRRVNNRLPNYQDLIEDIASQYNIDWRLLAAIAYQESHWNPHAKSPTGVRGMMMLTQGTANDMGIKNRLDASQSLRGGAKYLNRMLRRLPKDITAPDRTWFALAAYNVGLGHVKDAQKITEFHGGNANKWADVKQYLPLLEKREWNRFTTYGHARGSEPVSYVQNIRHFSDLLEWRFPNTSTNISKNIKNEEGISIETLKPETIKEAKIRQQQNLQSNPRLTQALQDLFNRNQG